MSQNENTITINTSTTTLVALTRVYKVAKTGDVKTQPMSVNSAAVASVVPSNRLGRPEHRSTITLTSGATFDLQDRYTEVLAALAA